MIKIAFWLAAGTIVYTYVLFPVLLYLRARFRPRPIAAAACTPRVSMVICAHNEAKSIGAKLENALSLDYPRELLEIIVASDGSDDGTDAIVASFAERGVTLLSLPRNGKIPTLNAAAYATNGEVLVFSDANSMYAEDALRRLLGPFGDPRVGCVAGDQRYIKGGAAGASTEGERTYWDFDRKLKEWGSAAGSATSATGAIYAIRRSLFREVPSGVTDDFFISTSAIQQGARLVFAGDAAAYERVAAKSGVEFRRKVRVITRGLRGVIAMRSLLDPRRYGFYSVQVFSHKVLRRLVVVPLLVLLPASVAAAIDGPFYAACAAAQVGLYVAAAIGGVCERFAIRVPKVGSLPFYFCMVNAAALMALLNVLRGRRIDRWSPRGEEPSASPDSVAVQTVAGT